MIGDLSLVVQKPGNVVLPRRWFNVLARLESWPGWSVLTARLIYVLMENYLTEVTKPVEQASCVATVKLDCSVCASA